MAPGATASAVYDEYLEGKMRVLLEGMVAALLIDHPADDDAFYNCCTDWLVKWSKDHDPDQQEVAKLKAERDALLRRRDELLASGGNSSSSTAKADAAAAPQGAEAKPKAKGKKRRAGVSAESVDVDKMENWKAPFHEKPQEARKKLFDIIAARDKLQVLLGHLTEESKYAVIDAMFMKEVVSGDTVITQGEEGDNFYIIDDGTFDCFVARGNSDPEKVLEYNAGDCFGELALLYNAPRAATVKATSNAKLWALERDAFKMMLSTAESCKPKQHEEFLEKIEIFKTMTKYEIGQISDIVQSDDFDPDEEFVTQGEVGEFFYILEEGEAKAYMKSDAGEAVVETYKPGDYFGGSALAGLPHKISIRGFGENGCTVLNASKEDFEKVLPLSVKEALIKASESAEYVAKGEVQAITEHKKAAPKRRAGVSAAKISDDKMKNWKQPFYEKPQDVRERIKEIISNHPKLQVMFGSLTAEAVFNVIDAMQPKDFESGATVITQGEDGDNFYIINEGTFDVYVARGNATPEKVLEYKPGDMFGELALLYNAPRAATVKATSSSKVWALDAESFRIMLTTSESIKLSKYEDFLGAIDIFKSLTKFELQKLSDLVDQDDHDDGEDIFKQDDEGAKFYILEEGEAKAYMTGPDGEKMVKHYKVPGEFFGEVSLLTNEGRRATVRGAGEGCSVLSLSREDFEAVLGPVKDVLQAGIASYAAYADIAKDE
eukprot:TRINITY_DN34569_c0_g1_i1.p1 TRINITY_DN34569_c0_g1~~TRINITY_DN34569_c0_g1_i1.p1  ORF type:complete len:718 (-),score=206.55 TRINITY_DN34569_c0_g1_i1:85-2238(-)